MEMKILALLFSLVWIVASDQCAKEHQTYQACGSACQPTCRNQKPQICTMQCVAGCFCEEGYLKNDQGDCVLPENCDDGSSKSVLFISNSTSVECNENENFTECGTACEPSCDNPGPTVCTKQCVQGCFCTEGLVRNSDGSCVELSQCHNKQPSAQRASTKCDKPNQEFKECGSACEPICNRPTPEACTAQCVQGCFCKNGYIKDAHGNCVDSSNCQVSTPAPANQCGSNETFVSCPNPCPTTCDNPNPRVCTLMCIKEGCQCNKGYVKNSNGQCVLPSDCPASRTTRSANACGPNEEYVSCPTPCPKTCQYPNPRICAAMCMAEGCQCKDGYLRNDKNQCVLPKQCQAPSTPTPGKCGRNEEYSSCPSPCPKTCDNGNPMCTAMCVPAGGCQCKQGFVKNAKNQCVLPVNCKRENKPSNDNRCGANEKWSNDSCAHIPACQPGQCPNNPPIMCPAICLSGGACICKDGFMRDQNQNCVHPEDCEESTSQPGTEDPCNPNPCKNGQTCQPEFKACFAPPCPQYKCD